MGGVSDVVHDKGKEGCGLRAPWKERSGQGTCVEKEEQPGKGESHANGGWNMGSGACRDRALAWPGLP